MHNKAMALIKLKTAMSKKSPKEISEYIDEFKGPDVEPDMEKQEDFLEKSPQEQAADNLVDEKALKIIKGKKQK